MIQNDRIRIGEIISVNHLIGNKKGSHTEFPTDNCKYYQLLYKLSGEAVITYGTKTVRETADDLRLTPDPQLFSKPPAYYADVISEGASINISFTTDSPLPCEITVRGYNSAPTLKTLFGKLQKLWYYKHDGYYYRCLAVLYEIFAVIAEEETRYLPSKTYKLIQPAIGYIDEHFTEQVISNLHLADLCGISQAYMTKLFKTQFGASPNQYIITKKLQYACDLLKSGEYSVSEVAQKVGFSSAYYFSRVFRERIGICPSKY